jgi:hypothetical protein
MIDPSQRRELVVVVVVVVGGGGGRLSFARGFRKWW